MDKCKLLEWKEIMISYKVDRTKIDHMYQQNDTKELIACVSCNHNARSCLFCDQCPGCCLSGVNLEKNFWTIEEFVRVFKGRM